MTQEKVEQYLDNNYGRRPSESEYWSMTEEERAIEFERSRMRIQAACLIVLNPEIMGG